MLTFADGLKYGLRQDPDVILVGEIRDRETAQMALSRRRDRPPRLHHAAHPRREGGGHALRRPVPAGRAAGGAGAAGDEPAGDREPAAAAGRRARREKRHLALEVLWNTHPIASAIRTGKIESIDNYILTGRDEGMVSFDESVRQLLRAGKITRKVAEQNVNDVRVLEPVDNGRAGERERRGGTIAPPVARRSPARQDRSHAFFTSLHASSWPGAG